MNTAVADSCACNNSSPVIITVYPKLVSFYQKMRNCASVSFKGHFISCSEKFSTQEFRNKFLKSFRTQKTSIDSWRPEMNIWSCFGRDKGKHAAFSVCQLGGIERFVGWPHSNHLLVYITTASPTVCTARLSIPSIRWV
jgi:hypothetical protein